MLNAQIESLTLSRSQLSLSSGVIPSESSFDFDPSSLIFPVNLFVSVFFNYGIGIQLLVQ